MDDKLSAKTVKIVTLENLYAYGVLTANLKHYYVFCMHTSLLRQALAPCHSKLATISIYTCMAMLHM